LNIENHALFLKLSSNSGYRKSQKIFSFCNFFKNSVLLFVASKRKADYVFVLCICDVAKVVITIFEIQSGDRILAP